MREWLQYGLVAAITATVIEIARRIFKIEILNRGSALGETSPSGGRMERVLSAFNIGIEKKGECLYTITAELREADDNLHCEFRVDHNSVEAGLDLLIEVIDKAETAEMEEFGG